MELVRHSVVRDEQTVIVSQANEISIKEPMACGRERYAVLNDVRSAVFDGEYVRSLNLSSASAVHHPQSGNSAGFVVGGNHSAPKRPISQGTVYEHLCDPAFLHLRGCLHELLKGQVGL